MRTFMMVLAVVAILPGMASAAAPCTALERFTAARPDLTAAQQQFLREALPLGNDLPPRKAMRFVEEARELFSHNERGALFTSMGPMQRVLSLLAAIPAYCDCPGNPCVGGSCVSGCISWDGEDGVRRDGLCVMPAPGDL
jgi:hypothetical protein